MLLFIHAPENAHPAAVVVAAGMPDNPPVPAARSAVQRIQTSDLSSVVAMAPHRTLVGKVCHYVLGL